MKLIQQCVVPVNVAASEPYRPRYIVLRNKDRKEILACAKRNSGIWVLPFITVPPVDISGKLPDTRWLLRRGSGGVRTYVMLPWYVGNFTDPEIVAAMFNGY